MATELESKNTNPLHKEFQSLLDEDFKDRKVKENEIIAATVSEITNKYIVVDANLKMEGMIPIEEFKNDDELKNLKVGSKIEVYLERIESGRSGEVILSRYTSIVDPTFNFDSSSSFLNSSTGIMPSILALQSTTTKFFVISVTVA